ncbi:hypothetical protein HFP05_16945 [Rhodanobacter denitrificans]|nr:hypothetical protein [Rhodanobacter denitrificans]
MSGPVDVFADLRGVVRIAKAASIGVTGNAPRIERAECALEAVKRLRNQAAALAGAIEFRIDDPRAALLDDLRTAVANVGGAA